MKKLLILIMVEKDQLQLVIPWYCILLRPEIYFHKKKERKKPQSPSVDNTSTSVDNKILNLSHPPSHQQLEAVLTGLEPPTPPARAGAQI